MSESRTRYGVPVGLFIFFGLAVFAGAVFAIGDLEDALSRRIHVSAVFDEVGGLQPGHNIWLSGVRVGRVGKMQLVEGGQVEVDLILDADAAQIIRADSVARVGLDGLIGNRIVILRNGASEVRITDGGALAVESVMSIDDVLESLEKNSQNLLAITKDIKVVTDRLARGEGTVGRLLADDTLHNDVMATTGSLRDAAGAFERVADEAEQILASLDGFAQALGEEGTAAIHDVAGAAREGSAAVQALSAATKDPTKPLGMLLHDEEAALELAATLEAARRSAVLLEEDLEALQHSWPLKKYFKKQAKKAQKEERKRERAEQ